MILRDIQEYVATCHVCQQRSTVRPKIPLTVSSPTALFQKIYTDVMFMPTAQGFKAIVAARDDLSGASEGRAIKKVNARTIAKFLQEEIVLRYGVPEAIITDNGSEFAGAAQELLRRHDIPQIRISPYNSRANGVVERGHFNIREALVKFCDGDLKKWPNHVKLAFFADRITTRRATGVSPYFALYGVEPRLPIDLAEATFLSGAFAEGMSTASLLSARMVQMQRREKDISDLAKAIRISRWGTKERYEREYSKRLRAQNFGAGDLVLMRNMGLESTVGLHKKTESRYLGPYCVHRRMKGGSYVLEELDGLVSRRGVAAFRLIPYLARAGEDL